MKQVASRMKAVPLTLAIVGSFSVGAVGAFQTTIVGGKCVNPETGCPCKPGCRYGGRVGCCLLP
ncbi:hypothetical protein [Lysobacter capsici]|uniref:hypothetical protein n=1 Tax=Lysobacter capsici TaxID=435897 RepID=UPI001BFFE061|nr:hypothetical protein [Lysobacter capsici]QWF17124.1 hypothetical protein KME82_25940 [Lysobacter capsici]